MSIIKRYFLLLCLSTAGVLSSEFTDYFEDYMICKDTNIKAPPEPLEVRYGYGGPFGNYDDVKVGNGLFVSKVEQKPTKVSYAGKPDSFYTLFMIDLDVKNNPGQVLLWMKRNIKGTNFDSGDDTNTKYLHPSPTELYEYHRCVFLLYEHDQKLVINFKTSALDRMHFYIDKFAEENQLGDPKFGNFFIGELAEGYGQ